MCLYRRLSGVCLHYNGIQNLVSSEVNNGPKAYSVIAEYNSNTCSWLAVTIIRSIYIYIKYII